MKQIITIALILFSTACFSQKYCLIDRKWRKPMILVDTVTSEDLNKGLFPIFKIEMDTLIMLTEKLLTFYKKSEERTVFNMKEYSAEHFEFNVANVKFAYGDRYNIDLVSWNDDYKISLSLCTSQFSNAVNSKKLQAFVDYLKDGKKAWPGLLQ